MEEPHNYTALGNESGWNRRSWLALMAAVLGDGLASRTFAQDVDPTQGDRRPLILVIGAGLAGLAAARQLQAQGRNVLVLEARQRLGGRLWTSLKWPDMPLDLGASWIHGEKGNPLTQLADDAHAERIRTSYDRNVVYDAGGDELTDEQIRQYERLRSRFYRTLRATQDAHDDVSIRELVRTLANEFDGDAVMMRQLNFLVSSEMEQEYGGSADRLSAHWYDHAKEFDGEDALFVKGFQVIVDLLAAGLSIHTEQVVQRIDWSEDAVSVVTSRGVYSVEKVLVTLPLGVLKAGHVEFIPPLPNAKSEAISKLEMGVLNKCYLLFPKVFWPADVDWLEYMADQAGEWTEWVSFARVASKPILLGFNAGDGGRGMEAWSDERIVSSAMQTLRTLFGAEIPDPDDYQITRWASDPFTLGSYSFNPVGCHPMLRRQLAKPIDSKIYFAGEATEYDFFGTAHGAYLSGVRAAKEMLQ